MNLEKGLIHRKAKSSLHVSTRSLLDDLLFSPTHPHPLIIKNRIQKKIPISYGAKLHLPQNPHLNKDPLTACPRKPFSLKMSPSSANAKIEPNNNLSNINSMKRLSSFHNIHTTSNYSKYCLGKPPKTKSMDTHTPQKIKRDSSTRPQSKLYSSQNPELRKITDKCSNYIEDTHLIIKEYFEPHEKEFLKERIKRHIAKYVSSEYNEYEY